MTCKINADTSGGLKLISDTSGSVDIQTAGTTIATASSTGITMASGKKMFSTGASLQFKNVQTNAFASTQTFFPIDDTIPQSGEGAELFTLAITPSSASNILIIDVQLNMTGSLTNGIIGYALFQDSTANALNAVWASDADHANSPTSPKIMRHVMDAGTTNATTFKIRYGNISNSSGVCQINGGSGARYLGGALTSRMTITEIGG